MIHRCATVLWCSEHYMKQTSKTWFLPHMMTCSAFWRCVWSVVEWMIPGWYLSEQASVESTKYLSRFYTINHFARAGITFPHTECSVLKPTLLACLSCCCTINPLWCLRRSHSINEPGTVLWENLQSGCISMLTAVDWRHRGDSLRGISRIDGSERKGKIEWDKMTKWSVFCRCFYIYDWIWWIPFISITAPLCSVRSVCPITVG